MDHKPNIVDGPIDNEFAIIKSVLDHRDRLQQKKIWGVDQNEIMEMIKKYMMEISKRPLYTPMPVDPYWLHQQPMIPLTGRRESIFIIDDPLNRSENL